ncbi:Spy/CpxP family protein refolding chaperone [Paraglaciecola sp. L3A3]|uniref:Spy/CpxP family protein refolding chaperone n=1 Tax=Paraglaciecola sp. L3A3 TaxID=2686358 RepID=UPI00131D552A|nr:Spy/CpxP family protein refolding chaperone [Paraglaciecola sp. L3A3]
MFKLKTVITPIAVCLSLALSSQVLAKPERGHERHKMAKVFSQLSLTNAQKQDIKQIFKQSRADRQATGPEAQPLRQDIASLVHATEWDQEAVETLLGQQQNEMLEAGLKRAENRHAVLSILTDEQKAQLTAMKEAHKDKGEHKGKRAPKGKNKGKSEKRFKRGLSAEQTAAIESIKSQSKESAEVLKEKLKAFKQAERSLITSAEFDAESWTSLRQEYQHDFLAMSVLQAKTKHDMWNVLTPEQQSKMQRMMKRKHKGERKGKRQQKEA